MSLTLNPERAAALLAAYRSPRNATRGRVPAATVAATRPTTASYAIEGRHREFPDPNKVGEPPRWRHARRMPRQQREVITIAVFVVAAILTALVVAVTS